jgi:hypothetical protein
MYRHRAVRIKKNDEMYNLIDEIHLIRYFPTFLTELLTFKRDLLTGQLSVNIKRIK